MQSEPIDPCFDSEILAAIIHEARQPLVILHNYISVLGHLSGGFDSTQEGLLVQKCIAEMRLAVERLSSTMSKISVIWADGEPQLEAKMLPEFILETFRIARFCGQRRQMVFECVIGDGLPEVPVFDAEKLQHSVIKWLLDRNCGAPQLREHCAVLQVSAHPVRSGVAIKAHCRSMEWQALIECDSKSPCTFTC